jgi:antitoxin (DNA-binding transcriptional repressor) of toxin-antitoxin stability system
MDTVTIDIAETTLSELLERVEAGEEIALTRGKQPIAKLTPFRPSGAGRRFGALKGKISVGPEFFEPLLEQELAAWE